MSAASLGAGQEHVAVSVSAISVTQNGKSWLTINTTREIVKKASGYKCKARKPLA
jgi:hypothetical protein